MRSPAGAEVAMPLHSSFVDRVDAGRQLAEALLVLDIPDPLVLALPRGGVPVAFEVAKALHAPLDVLIVRKIGAPGHDEYGIGAVVDGADPQLILNEEALRIVNPPPGYVERKMKQQLEEIERRRSAYIGTRAPMPVKDRNVIVVDDGIATGGTVRAALKSLRQSKAESITLAVPVAPQDALDLIAPDADHILCLERPPIFNAVGQHYRDFAQVSDEEVIHLLHAARSFATAGA
jgi:putative phosphoribosyl transferase